METNSTDYVCNLDCPDVVKNGEPPMCCKGCFDARKNYLNKDNNHLWTEAKGFWSKIGCRLLREDMPLECKEYDCRKYTFAVLKRWAGKWNEQFCLLKGQQVEKKCFKSAKL